MSHYVESPKRKIVVSAGFKVPAAWQFSNRHVSYTWEFDCHDGIDPILQTEAMDKALNERLNAWIEAHKPPEPKPPAAAPPAQNNTSPPDPYDQLPWKQGQYGDYISNDNKDRWLPDIEPLAAQVNKSANRTLVLGAYRYKLKIGDTRTYLNRYPLKSDKK